MAVHALDLHVSTTDPNGDPVDAQARKQEAQNWVDNHNEALETQRADFSAGDATVGGGGTDYYHALWRFDLAEWADPSDAKDDIATWLNNHFGWWWLRHHECDHDDEERGGCSWDHEWTGGAVPTSVQEVG